MDSVEVIVVGAGVVGLAIARHLAMAGRETLVLEQHAAFGTETSARNSEVVHSGLHYAKGSLKARLCVRGRAQLYELCERMGVGYRRCGKLIVATSEPQVARLQAIAAAARDNGVDDVQLIDGEAARALEPELTCVAALNCPSTGIIDSHGLMVALLGEAERYGAVLACRTTVMELRPDAGGVAVLIEGDSSPQLRARWIINAAGLGAVRLAENTRGLPAQFIPRAYLAKGSYFALAGPAPFARLIYPVPEPGGLGVHLTLDLGGQARFGPDVEWVNTIDYRVEERRSNGFHDVIRAYWPGIERRTLLPAYCGVRPKIAGPGDPAADFRIDGPSVHGVPGIVNLFGIESPGLTAALAIGEYVTALLEGSTTFAGSSR